MGQLRPRPRQRRRGGPRALPDLPGALPRRELGHGVAGPGARVALRQAVREGPLGHPRLLRHQPRRPGDHGGTHAGELALRSVEAPSPPRPALPHPPLMATGPPLTAPSPPLTASTRVAWQVLQKCGFGLSTEQSEGFASQLLQGQASVKTTQLLDNFQVKFKESSESEQGPRPTPAWAKALLDTARCPPQLPPPCHHRPVPISPGPQQRGSTPQHPDTQAHVRARVHTVSCRSASTAPRSPCPPAGEQAVRRAEVELTRPLPLLRQER